MRPSALEPGGGIRRPWFFFRRRRRRGSGAIVCDSVAPGKRRRERRTTTGDRLVAEAQPALKTDPFIVIPSTVQTAQQYPYKRRGRRRTTSAGGLLAARFLYHASVALLWFHPPATPHLVPAAAQSSPYDEFHYPGFQAYVKVSDLEGDFYLTGGTITEPTENPGFFSTEFTYIDPSTQEVTGETCSLLQDYRPAIEANAEALAKEGKNPFSGTSFFSNYGSGTLVVPFVVEVGLVWCGHSATYLCGLVFGIIFCLVFCSVVGRLVSVLLPARKRADAGNTSRGQLCCLVFGHATVCSQSDHLS